MPREAVCDRPETLSAHDAERSTSPPRSCTTAGPARRPCCQRPSHRRVSPRTHRSVPTPCCTPSAKSPTYSSPFGRMSVPEPLAAPPAHCPS
eukprot:2799551-Pleurochrysis_carterae.AAC.3